MNMDEFKKLEDVCENYFNVSYKIARHKASLGVFQIPAFRLSGNRRGPFYVRKDDLEAYVKKQVDAAVKLNSQMRMAGAV